MQEIPIKENLITEHVQKYFRGEDLTTQAFLDKYSENRAEIPEVLIARTAKEFYRAEQAYPDSRGLSLDDIHGYFDEFKYLIPQGSVLASLGVPNLYSSLSNCTVLGAVPDSYGGIGYRDQQLVHLMKRRCGVGIEVSGLRPEGTPVNNSAKLSTGVVSFMHRFSNTTREVAQGGRRGALMLSMEMGHPDSKKFVESKQDTTQITGANISVQLRDDFMNAVISDNDFILKFPLELDISKIQDLESQGFNFPKDDLVAYPDQDKSWVRKVSAKEHWDTLIKCAWSTAEPGLIFRTRHDDYCPSNIYPKLKNRTTNPCGEIMQGDNDSCRLIADNLYSLVLNPFTEKAKLDWFMLKEVARDSVRLCDGLVDLEIESIDRIINKIKTTDPEELRYKRIELETWEDFRETGLEGRRMGIGFTGLADMLAALGLKYDSPEAIEFTELVMRTKFQGELEEQIELAKERGAFPSWDAQLELEDSERPESWFYFVRKEFPVLWTKMQRYGRRSCSWSTVAPCGTISMLPGVQAGIEPVYMLRYTRRKKVNPDVTDVRVDFVDDNGDSWTNFPQLHPKFKLWIEINHQKVLNGREVETLSEEEFVLLEKESPWHKATAEEIDWKMRVAIQASVQKYTTHSISATINLPENTSVNTISDIYLESWKQGLKGITVYRDGSRSGVLVKDATVTRDEETHIPKRPDILKCSIVRFQNNSEHWIAFIGLTEEGRPYEVFTGLAEGFTQIPKYVEKGQILKRRNEIGEKHYDLHYNLGAMGGETKVIRNLETSFNPEYWNYAKLVSGLLRHRMPLEYVITTLKGLSFEDVIHTWRNGVVRSLKKFVKDGVVSAGSKCDTEGCTGKVIYQEGCEKCLICGNSKCG